MKRLSESGSLVILRCEVAANYGSFRKTLAGATERLMNPRDWPFLQKMRRTPSKPPLAQPERLHVINVTRSTELASHAEAAKSGGKRSRGLLGRRGLASGEGMWIVPCEAIHTFFMRFKIDLVYLDRRNQIKKVVSSVPPWRFSACLSAYSVLELPSGTVQKSQSCPGDLVEFSPVSDTVALRRP